MHEHICMIIQLQQYGTHLIWHRQRVLWSRWWSREEGGGAILSAAGCLIRCFL